MAVFAINGWEIEVAELSRSRDAVFGSYRRARSGRLRHSRLSLERSWSGKTSLLTSNVSDFLRPLLDGEGDNWSFENDVYSSKGLAFSTTPSRDTSNFKFGTASMTAASGVTYTVTSPYGTVRTVLLWRRAGSGSFNHYALVLTGATITAKYKNGATTAETVTNWFTALSNGSFSLLGKNDSGTDTTVQYDDVTVLKGHAPADAVAGFSAATEGWADLPAVRLSGDLVDASNASVEVIPEYKSSTYINATDPYEALSFEMREV